MDLILWRHAEAEDVAPDHTDAGRRLTPKGQAEAQKMAVWLNKHIPSNTSILVSPSIRTQETAEALKHPYKLEPRLSATASVADCIEVISEQNIDSTFLLVGHQPTLGQLAAQLLSGRAQLWSIQKGEIWWITLQSTVPVSSAKLKIKLSAVDV